MNRLFVKHKWLRLAPLLSRRLSPLALALLLAGCATHGTPLPDNRATCVAIPYSPKYDGQKLAKAGFKPLRRWTSNTNKTLKNLGCPLPRK
jgi:hypothetical protein